MARSPEPMGADMLVGTCRKCFREYWLTDAGKLCAHEFKRARCTGSQKPPVKDSAHPGLKTK